MVYRIVPTASKGHVRSYAIGAVILNLKKCPTIFPLQMLPRAPGPVHGDLPPGLGLQRADRDALRREALRQDPAQAQDIPVQGPVLRLPVGQGQRDRRQVLRILQVHTGR